MSAPKNRIIMLVIEETGVHNGQGFEFYVAGDKERLGVVPVESYSPAEVWGERLFGVCFNALKDAGVITTLDGEPLRPSKPASDKDIH